jgi:porin
MMPDQTNTVQQGYRRLGILLYAARRVVLGSGAVQWRRVLGALFLAIAALGAGQLQAQDGIIDVTLKTPQRSTSLPDDSNITGARKWFGERGISYGLTYTSDILSNLSGGNKRGTIYQGKVEGTLTVDLEKLAGWQDLTLYSNAFQIHNTGRMRRDYVGGMNTIAAIEASPTTRLSELWLEQKFLDGNASFRIGQLAADSEFFFSDISIIFMQTDWPTIAAVNLPGGGPAYPLSTPGARLKLDAAKDVSLLLAIFNGDPAGPGTDDADIRNRYGLNFRLRDPALIIGEAQFRSNRGKDDSGLARTLKLGGWGHLGEFDDQRYADDGSLIADPTGSGSPAKRRGNYGLYAIIDQQIYRPEGGAPDSGVTVFSRASISPSDRSLIAFHIDGGIVFSGLIASRPDDCFGASVIYARFSDSARGFDQDQINFSGAPGVVRDHEINLELSYVAQIDPGWTVQPDFQYIWHPSGQAGRDAIVVGVRSIWKF